MTTLSRVLAYGLGALLVGGLVVLAVAGVPAATAVLVTAGAVLALIIVGGAMRGRRSSGRPPAPEPGPPGAPRRPEPGGPPVGGAGDVAGGGTMEG